MTVISDLFGCPLRAGSNELAFAPIPTDVETLNLSNFLVVTQRGT